mmetsp:Transcript_40396/g.67697  ORF Transcript_40396/g.67697 Transcript_40396/m.67697 type:complete len:297 (+) Transcript_40396:190-1080(+)
MSALALYVFILIISHRICFGHLNNVRWVPSKHFGKPCRFYDKGYTHCTPYRAVKWKSIEKSVSTNLRQLASKTLFFYGDSIQRQIFREIVCRLGPIKIRKPALRTTITSLWDVCYEFKLSTLTLCFATASGTNHTQADVDVLSKMASMQPNVILVANFGVHYNLENPGDLSELSNRCFIFSRMASSFGLSKIVFWRQTLAQHFKTKNGAFSSALAHGDMPCANTRNETFEGASWRNNACDGHFYHSSIRVIETFEESFYAPAELHVGTNGDCTHFCQPGYVIFPVDIILKVVVGQT